MRRKPDGTYVTVERPVLFLFFAVLVAFSLAQGAWQWYLRHGVNAGTIGFALGVGIAVTSALGLPVIRFSFDPARKLITWTSRSFLNSDGGQLSFSDVRDVVLQSSVDDKGITTYRVALATSGRTLPLAFEYIAAEKKTENLAAAIRSVLGFSGSQRQDGLDYDLQHADGARMAPTDAAHALDLRAGDESQNRDTRYEREP